MKKANIILAIELGEIFTADFISMAILVICMCFPIVLIIWLGFNNYYSTGHIFSQEKTYKANDEIKEIKDGQTTFPSPDPTLDNK